MRHFRTYIILYRRIENGVYITWKNSNLIIWRQDLASMDNLVVIDIISIRLLSVLKLSLPLNNQSINLMNLQEVNWNEMTEEQNLDVYKFNIDVTDNDVHQCKEVLSIIIYLVGY